MWVVGMSIDRQPLMSLESQKTGGGNAPYIIAETACAHDGNPDQLQSLVSRIAEEEPDAIQVQIFSPDHQVTPDHEIHDEIHDLAISWGEWEEIMKDMDKLDPGIFVFAYDRPSLEFALEHDIDGIKLSSADLTNPEMVQIAAEADPPTTLSTGGGLVDEVAKTVDQYTEIDDKGPILMHGMQNFPTKTENAWINRIRLLKDLFGLPVGYQDHTDGERNLSNYIDLVAVGAGTDVLEKHVALSRSDTDTDFEAALEPDEFAEFVDAVRAVGDAMGSDRYRSLSDSERKYNKFQKKKIITTKEIKQGERLSREQVKFLRNGSDEGVSPREFEKMENNPVTRDIPAFHPLEMSDVEMN
jgi:sialic acid synthase SpsE